MDAQIRQQQEIHKAEEDAIIFSRMMALSGSFIAFYTVDPVTDDYYLYNASEDFFALDTKTFGTEFFESALEDVKNIIPEEEYEHFCENFRKDIILKKIDETGMYSIKYHILLGRGMSRVCLKAAKLLEDGVEKLIIGVEEISDSNE